VNDKIWFEKTLYPFQDEVLRIVSELKTPFYLSGGTAASRGYLNHRYSEDLDFFVNDRPDFGLWAERLIERFRTESGWSCRVNIRESRFVRLTLENEDAPLKIELINDVPAHAGSIRENPELGRVDSPENILANKITALIDRAEPKDFADIWGFCCVRKMELGGALDDASSKASGIFPLDLARVLYSVDEKDWAVVRWVDPPDRNHYIADLKALGGRLI
jgi:predicted nucleotidyltransferase component of viral defense system